MYSEISLQENEIAVTVQADQLQRQKTFLYHEWV